HLMAPQPRQEVPIRRPPCTRNRAAARSRHRRPAPWPTDQQIKGLKLNQLVGRQHPSDEGHLPGGARLPITGELLATPTFHLGVARASIRIDPQPIPEGQVPAPLLAVVGHDIHRATRWAGRSSSTNSSPPLSPLSPRNW